MTEAEASNDDSWTTRPIVIVGMTGVGKSTTGAHLARRLNRHFVDLDHFIVEKTGRSIPQIFAEKGEVGFRQLETRALQACLERGSDIVLSTGGGAVVSDANRNLLRQGALVLWLQADVDVLLDRVSTDVQRPLLKDDPGGVLKRLSEQRQPWYDEVSELAVLTSGSTINEVVDDLVSMIEDRFSEPIPASAPPQARYRHQPRDGVSSPMIIEQVDLADGRRYPVLVGPGARHELASVIPEGVKRVAVVTQQGIDVAVDPGVDHQVFMVEAGEQAKRMSVVEDLARSFAQWGMTRNDAVVAVGGGVVTDLGGFVAASYHRGIRVIHVSTTLLGQIDASIGGKCGVNLPEGKNLVGAFWQPSAVICDTETLETLPREEFLSGMGELAKYHFLGGGNLDQLPLPERVAACVRIKADVVAADEREGGKRAILNYGHTLGHALETSSAERSGGVYGIRHGEGVAIGLVYAAEVAHALGRIDADRVAEHRRVLHAYDLSFELPADSDTAELVELFRRDKKASDGTTFVLDGPNGVESVRVDDDEMLRECLSRMSIKSSDQKQG